VKKNSRSPKVGKKHQRRIALSYQALAAVDYDPAYQAQRLESEVQLRKGPAYRAVMRATFELSRLAVYYLTENALSSVEAEAVQPTMIEDLARISSTDVDKVRKALETIHSDRSAHGVEEAAYRLAATLLEVDRSTLIRTLRVFEQTEEHAAMTVEAFVHGCEQSLRELIESNQEPESS
jgi:hypothetical protein